MSWGLVAVAGATVVGGALSSDASRKGANKQSDAANASSAESRRQFDMLYNDQQPFREVGQGAVRELAGMRDYDPTPSAEDVMNEPGYQFGLDQGRNAIQGTAAAKGGLYSGRALKELTAFGGDYGTTRFGQAYDRKQQAFGSRWNRLASLAGLGQTSVQQSGAAGLNLGNTIGNNLTGAANAQAASGLQRANIWGNAAGQLGGYMAWNGGRQQSPRSSFRYDDPYRTPGYFGGDEGE